MGTGNQPRRNKDKLSLGQKVSDLELNITHKNMVIIVTNKDTEITADLIICCTGMKINTAAYSSNLNGTSPGNLDQVTQGYPGPYTNAKDPQGLVKSLMSVLQTYKKQTASQGNDHVFKLWGKAPKTKKSTNEIKPRVNILTDPTYSEPLVKVNMILGLFFYGFIMIVFIYDSVRVSMEARRRSDALADARLKRKEPPPVEPQSTLSKYRQSIASLFRLENTSSIADGLKANYPKEEPESNIQFADCAKGKSAVSLREWDPLPKSQLTDVCVN
ncbi:uncharacterized protein LOC115153119 [Salmo trutta]|uniref:uncharacterized protein LOC115153119 n=1 Tax=Salmo trutta TaxID=8032 RepID=UPI001132758E|nr:uncharacterized protein LOC115153119 [Salmo trutta]